MQGSSSSAITNLQSLVCDVCGDNGNEEAVVPCTKCTIARHLYCMEIFKMEIPKKWVCENCPDNECVLNPSDMDYAEKEKEKEKEEQLRKLGKSCKIKTLSDQEVRSLKTSELVAVNPNPKLERRFQAIARRNTVAAQKRLITKRTHTVPKDNKGKWVLATPSKDNGRHDELTADLIRPHTKHRKTRTLSSLLSSSSAPKKNPGQKFSDKLINKTELYFQYFPAQYSIWKGGISYSDSSTVIDFGGFQAKPPRKLHRKAFECSRKLPSILELEPLGERLVLDFHDIALYIFPDERSDEYYASLLNLMETKKTAMRTFFDGMELLLFTSKQLQAGSWDAISKLNMNERFIFGIFRFSKKNQALLVEMHEEEAPQPFGSQSEALAEVHEQPPQPLGPPLACEAADMEVDMEIDMEIDMEVSPKKETGKIIVSCLENGPFASESPLARLLPVPLNWVAPPAGWVKLNIEACSKVNSGLFRIAGVILDHKGHWVYGYSRDAEVPNMLTAVFWAIVQGLQTLWRMGFKNVLVESTCRKAVKYVGSSSARYDVESVMAEVCRELINRNWVCKVSCIHTEANKCATWLASNVEKDIIFEKPPEGMLQLLAALTP